MSWFVVHALCLGAAIALVIIRTEIGSLWGVATTCGWIVAAGALALMSAIDTTCLYEPHNCTGPAAGLYALAGVWYLSLAFLAAGREKPFKIATFILSFPLALAFGITPV